MAFIPDITTGDVRRFKLGLSLDSLPLSSATEITVAVLGVTRAGRNVTRAQVIDQKAAVYSAPDSTATESVWLLDLTTAETDLFLKTSGVPSSGLKYTEAALEVEVGDNGSFGTVVQDGFTVYAGRVT